MNRQIDQSGAGCCIAGITIMIAMLLGCRERPEPPSWAAEMGLYHVDPKARAEAWAVLDISTAGVGEADPPLRVGERELTTRLLENTRKRFRAAPVGDRVRVLRDGINDPHEPVALSAIAIAVEEKTTGRPEVLEQLLPELDRVAVEGDSEALRQQARLATQIGRRQSGRTWGRLVPGSFNSN